MARGYFRMFHDTGKLPRWAVGTQGVLQEEVSWSEEGKLAHCGGDGSKRGDREAWYASWGSQRSGTRATAPEEDPCAEPRLSICNLTAMATFVTLFSCLLPASSWFLGNLGRVKGLFAEISGTTGGGEMAPNHPLLEGDMKV